jgi:cytochrome b6-f complex iron-sulfur subunit
MPDRPEDPRPSRRRFCQVTGLVACGVAAGGAAALTTDFLAPRVLFEPPTRFALGPPDGVGVGEVITQEAFQAYVIRRADGFRALSSVCTHLGCITRYQPGEEVIACPCHGSRFDLDGEVLAGPAPRALRWLEMGLSSRGEIEVDTAREVPPGTVLKA